MTTKSSGQQAPWPNRQTGAKPHRSKKFGQVTPRGTGGGFSTGSNHGQTHVTKGGVAQGGSGSARGKGFGRKK